MPLEAALDARGRRVVNKSWLRIFMRSMRRSCLKTDGRRLFPEYCRTIALLLRHVVAEWWLGRISAVLCCSNGESIEKIWECTVWKSALQRRALSCVLIRGHVLRNKKGNKSAYYLATFVPKEVIFGTVPFDFTAFPNWKRLKNFLQEQKESSPIRTLPIVESASNFHRAFNSLLPTPGSHKI